MVSPNDKNKTPVRDRKVGLTDNNAPVNPNGVPPLVEKMVKEQNPSLFPSSGSSSSAGTSVQQQQQQPMVQPQNVFQSGGVSGRFEQPVTNFSQMQPKVNQGGQLWEGAQQNKGGFANPSVGPVQSPYMKDAAETTPQPQSNFENMPSPSTGWNADGSARNDELSSALSGFQYVSPSDSVPEFHKDETKRDGGFFSFLKGLMPKSRPGMRADETPDEYDERTTRNKERLAALADFMRHAGNIYNTSRYAPSQQFNDPTAKMEADLQNRKAQRRQREAMEQDAAYKQANLSMKERAAEADRQYKELSLGLKQRADERAAQKQKDDGDRWKERLQRLKDKDEYQKQRDDRNFKYKQAQDKIKNNQAERRISIAQQNANKRGSGRSGRSGSGSSARYWFEDKDGKMRYQPNKTMWEQEFYREYGKLPSEGNSTSTTTKTTDYKTGTETTVTTRTNGNSVTSQAAQHQNAARAARQNAKKSVTSNSKNGYKNTKKLGL